MNNPLQSTSCVLPQSKRISKPRRDSSREYIEERQNSNEYLFLETGYDTFLREEKDQILFCVKTQILAVKGLDSSLLGSEKSEKSLDWIKLFKQVGAKPVNQVLKKVIPRYRPNLDLTNKELTNLRKKIKGWFGSEGASEKRGDPLIHDDELPKFKEALRKIMKVRNFDQLRIEILPTIKEIRLQSSRRFDDSMFSKKFWSTFLNKETNYDIKALWEALPSIKKYLFPHKSMKKESEHARTLSMICEDETDEKPVKDVLADFCFVSSQEKVNFWAKDNQEIQLYDFENCDLQYPIQRFLNKDSDEKFSETAMGSSDDKETFTEEKPKANFLTTWDETEFSDSGSFQRLDIEPPNSNINNTFFGLSQDSYNKAS